MKQNFELVEKLVEKTGVSYAQANEALEKNNGDILDAIIWLEAEGMTQKASASYSTKRGEPNSGVDSDRFKSSVKSFGECLCSVIDKGNSNTLEIYRRGERKLSVPVTVFVILLIIGFWFVLPLMIVGLFFEFRYSFKGAELGSDKVNDAMGKATDIADSIKTEIKNSEKKTDNSKGDK
ncbi:MAG: DUF4342 domain-containing protein [Oscillospiraceae bacterium]